MVAANYAWTHQTLRVNSCVLRIFRLYRLTSYTGCSSGSFLPDFGLVTRMDQVKDMRTGTYGIPVQSLF